MKPFTRDELQRIIAEADTMPICFDKANSNIEIAQVLMEETHKAAVYGFTCAQAAAFAISRAYGVRLERERRAARGEARR